MIIEITEKFCIGDGASCFDDEKKEWVVIHACKDPCHKRAVGYSKNLSPSHPNYLIKEENKHLYLNMVDMEKILSHEFTEPIIKKAMEFIKEKIEENKILVHCNMGLSRSPALVLVFLAKVSKKISNKSYDEAKKDFIKLYPAYQPGGGIDSYLRAYWDKLDFDQSLKNHSIPKGVELPLGDR